MKVLIVTPVTDDKKNLFEAEGADIVFQERNKTLPADLQGMDAVLGNVPYEWVNNAPSVRWLQLDSAGIGTAHILRKDVLLTNASGAYGEAISEHMLAVTLAMMKNLYRYRELQRQHEWNNLGSVKTIGTCTVLAVGMGDIGSAYAQRMHALGAKVFGIRRTVHEKPDYVDGLFTMEHLNELLPKADITALSLPETPLTRHVINRETLSLMKPGSFLLNVGRGSAIDENALIQAVKVHHIAGAALDVTEQEPLPRNDPLWNTEGIYITPHISGRFNAEVTYDKIIDIFVNNLHHFVNHEPLEHAVDISRGY